MQDGDEFGCGAAYSPNSELDHRYFRVVQSRAYISRANQGQVGPAEGGGEEGRRLGHGSTRTNTPSETVGQH